MSIPEEVQGLVTEEFWEEIKDQYDHCLKEIKVAKRVLTDEAAKIKALVVAKDKAPLTEEKELTSAAQEDLEQCIERLKEVRSEYESSEEFFKDYGDIASICLKTGLSWRDASSFLVKKGIVTKKGRASRGSWPMVNAPSKDIREQVLSDLLDEDF